MKPSASASFQVVSLLALKVAAHWGAYQALLYATARRVSSGPRRQRPASYRASYYSTQALAQTLHQLIDVEVLVRPDMRLTVGAVSVRRGTLTYFDSRDTTLRIVAAIRIDRPAEADPSPAPCDPRARQATAGIAAQRGFPRARVLTGARTTMHIVRLLAPSLQSEDLLKDIDFSASGIRQRWQAGIDDANRIVTRAPWNGPIDPLEGVIVHELS
jgi:hypothetical protein